MPSMTRRTALSAAVGVLSSIAGCAGLRDADSFPIQRSWYTRISDPSSVAMAQDGRLLTGSHSPFRDRPLVAGLDSQTGENNWTVTVAKARNHPSPSITGRPTQSRRLKRWLPSMWPRVSLSGNARSRRSMRPTPASSSLPPFHSMIVLRSQFPAPKMTCPIDWSASPERMVKRCSPIRCPRHSLAHPARPPTVWLCP